MSDPRLVLKQSNGWFAAGREFSRALAVLSDGAFKLYVYVCLRANRCTGQLDFERKQLSRVLNKSSDAVDSDLEELCKRGVCSLGVRASSLEILEINEGFWPYVKRPESTVSEAQRKYISEVRQIFLAPACVHATFSAADEKIAANLYARGTSVEQVRRAVMLGCARKYVAIINGDLEVPVTSLKYFEAIIDEVTDVVTPDSYWKALSRKVAQMEAKWAR